MDAAFGRLAEWDDVDLGELKATQILNLMSALDPRASRRGCRRSARDGSGPEGDGGMRITNRSSLPRAFALRASS